MTDRVPGLDEYGRLLKWSFSAGRTRRRRRRFSDDYPRCKNCDAPVVKQQSAWGVQWLDADGYFQCQTTSSGFHIA